MDDSELAKLKVLLRPAADLEKVEISKSTLGELIKLKETTCEGCAFIFGLIIGAVVGAFALWVIFDTYHQLKF
jgi:hypothetical protein